jgi:hypothetical protein
MDLLILGLSVFGSSALLVYLENRDNIKKWFDDRWEKKCKRRKIII